MTKRRCHRRKPKRLPRGAETSKHPSAEGTVELLLGEFGSANLLQPKRFGAPRNRAFRTGGHLDRKGFLSITACGILRHDIGLARVETLPDGYWTNDGYRAIQVLRREGLFVEFVDPDTMPEGDVLIVVRRTSAELGLHIVGSIPFQLSMWFQQRTSSLEASIEPEAPVTVMLLADSERRRDVVLVLDPNDAQGDMANLETLRSPCAGREEQG
jgi:hypothetical protein